MIKRKIIYLYLSLICFVGFIAVFFVDGYMGIYDTLFITSGPEEQKIATHQWQRRNSCWIGSIWWGTEGQFRYEISNHKFSPYLADIEVSLWHSDILVNGLISQKLQIDHFGKAILEWTVDTVELEPTGPPPKTYPYIYFIIIKYNDVERKLKLYIAEPPSRSQNETTP